MPHIQLVVVTTSSARGRQNSTFGMDFDVSLGIVAIFAKYEFANKSVKHVLKLCSVMGSINDETFVLEVKLGLCSQFASKVLGRICKMWKKFSEINVTASILFYVKILTSRGTSEGPGNISHVGDDGFDSVALALDLGLQPGHFVPVEGILNLSVNVERHFGLSLIFSFLIETVFLLSSFEAFKLGRYFSVIACVLCLLFV